MMGGGELRADARDDRLRWPHRPAARLRLPESQPEGQAGVRGQLRHLPHRLLSFGKDGYPSLFSRSSKPDRLAPRYGRRGFARLLVGISRPPRCRISTQLM